MNPAGAADVDVLLIPGVATAKADYWIFASPKWLSEVLPSGLKRARVLAFDYTFSLSERDLSAQQLLVQGDVLLNALVGTRASLGDDARLLFIVCHSLGGLVLKQALCIAHEQSYRYGSVIASVAGIVFLGTPHRGTSDADTLARWLTILGSTTDTKKPITLPEHRAPLEAAMLSQLADRFEDINIQAHVLSVTESKKTRVSMGILKSKSLLVGLLLCCVRRPLTSS